MNAGDRLQRRPFRVARNGEAGIPDLGEFGRGELLAARRDIEQAGAVGGVPGRRDGKSDRNDGARQAHATVGSRRR